MSFRIAGLSPEAFAPLFGLSDEALRARGVLRRTVDAFPRYPDRIGLKDVEPGATVLLLNYEHQPAATPFRASHAIYVREGATRRFEAVDEVPPMLAIRPLSLRGFDADGFLRTADLAQGDEVAPAIRLLLSEPGVAYLHAHFARPGCFAARIDRAWAARTAARPDPGGAVSSPAAESSQPPALSTRAAR